MRHPRAESRGSNAACAGRSNKEVDFARPRGKRASATEMSELINYLRKTLHPLAVEEATDGQLLDRFLNRRESTALEVLVRRHSAMVWGVCRRLLRNEQDAEDAFQATFLVLMRKAASIASREQLANYQ